MSPQKVVPKKLRRPGPLASNSRIVWAVAFLYDQITGKNFSSYAGLDKDFRKLGKEVVKMRRENPNWTEGPITDVEIKTWVLGGLCQAIHAERANDHELAME